MIIKENNFSKFYLNTNNLDNIILFVNFKKQLPENNEWKETNNLIKFFYKNAENNNYKFSMIVDISNLGNIEFTKYNDWLELFNNLKEKTKKYIIKTCIITDSTILKNTINLFLIIYKPVRPMKILNNQNEALEFINNNN